MIPSSNIFLSLTWLQISLASAVFPIPGGPRIFTSLFRLSRESTSQISCCLPMKWSSLGGILEKNTSDSSFMRPPSLNLPIGYHLCSHFLFLFAFISDFLFTRRMYLLASVGVKKVFMSSFAILKASQTEYFFMNSVW